MKSIHTLIFIIFTLSAQGQALKTVQLFNPQTNDLTPFINKSEYLIFSFDDLDGDVKRYPYKIVRYDKDWNKSDLYTSEYLNGYAQNYIRTYQAAFNTRVNYTHYQVNIPNQDFEFKLSGNYSVQLLDPVSKKMLIEKRFAVYEDIAQISVQVDRMNGATALNQKIWVQVNSSGFDLTQNPNEAALVVLKNNNWQDKITTNSPSFALPHQYTFNDVNLSFAGGVEYNWFDTKNLEISGMTTQDIVRDQVYATILYPNEYNPNQTYVDLPDVNGNYYIRNTNIPDEARTATEADYTQVFFALSGYEPEKDEKVFVYGAFDDFLPTEESILSYHPDTGLLETHMLLKQGYYNYGFGVYNTASHAIDYHKIAGNYWQTENLYNALFYYRPWGKRYDLLIGYAEGASRETQR